MSEIAYLEDAAHKRRINNLLSDLAKADNTKRQYEVWHALKAELLARPQSLVRAMEAEMGLD